MAGSWAGKIKSAIEGLVDGADAHARLASAASLESLRRQLADRRLEAELEHIADPWRVPFVLAPFAAPLWIAEAFVTLAQSLSDAEAEAHADRPAMMSSLTHGQMLALLEPVDALQGEISGRLADPNRRSALALPLMARPFAHTSAGLLSDRVPASYARGLLAGAASLVATTQMLLSEHARFLEHGAAPDWIHAGLAAIRGDLAAAQTRFDAVQLRAAPVVRQQPPDESALRNLVVDLWDLTNTYVKVGQLLSAPALFPGARPLPGDALPPAVAQAPAAPLAPPSRPAVSVPPLPASQPAWSEPPSPVAAMPQIGGAPVTPVRGAPPGNLGERDTVAPPARPETGLRPAHPVASTQPAPAARMPEIGGPSRAAPPACAAQAPASTRPPELGAGPAHARVPETTARSMPSIGSGAEPPARPSAPPGRPPAADQARALPRIGGQAEAIAPPSRPSAVPASPATPGPRTTAETPVNGPGRRVERKDRWVVGAQGARYRMRAAGQEDQAEAQLAAFWEARGWSLTPGEARYLEQVSQHLKSGAVVLAGRSQAECPYAPIYRVGRAAIQVLEHTLKPGTLFSYDFRPGGQVLLSDLSPQTGLQDAT